MPESAEASLSNQLFPSLQKAVFQAVSSWPAQRRRNPSTFPWPGSHAALFALPAYPHTTLQGPYLGLVLFPEPQSQGHVPLQLQQGSLFENRHVGTLLQHTWTLNSKSKLFKERCTLLATI